MTRLLRILSALAMTLLLNLPGAHAQALWTDGFESGTYNGPWGPVPNNWTVFDGAGTGNFAVDCSVSHSGNCSLRLDYTDINIGQGPFMDRYFPSQNNLYLRFWIRSSPGFQFAPASTKLPYAPRCESNCAPGTPGWVPVAHPPSGHISWVGQGAIAGDVTLGTGRNVTTTWTCIEENVNYPAGTVTMWVNDEQVTQRSGMATTSAMTEDTWRMYQERGIGNLYYDDLAVSAARIGCGGTPPTADVPAGAPAAPRIISVTVQ